MGAGCARTPPRRALRVPVVVAQAQQSTVPFEIPGTGTVEPIQSAQITAQVGGLVVRVPFHEGDEVRAGQVLFQIDPRPYQAAVARAAGVLAKDHAAAEQAQVEYSRAMALAPQQLIAPTELDQKRAAAQSAIATSRADSASLVSARLDLANATVRAPITGKTGNRSVHVGDLVKENDTANPLVTINQLRPIRVRFTVPQSDLDDIRRQPQKMLVVFAAPAEHDSTWVQGGLAFIDNAVDPTSGTVLLKGEFANRDGALWPGQFVRVRLRLFQQAGTVVPSAAVTNSQNGSFCYVVRADTTVEVRPVVVRRNWQDLAMIASGIEPGETVVTDGQIRLSPGAKASIRKAPGMGGPGGARMGQGQRAVGAGSSRQGPGSGVPTGAGFSNQGPQNGRGGANATAGARARHVASTPATGTPQTANGPPPGNTP